jgi:hypothetical protein
MTGYVVGGVVATSPSDGWLNAAGNLPSPVAGGESGHASASADKPIAGDAGLTDWIRLKKQIT